MIDDIIYAPRTDAIYNMHGYLTKVPVKAILPFINEFSPPDGLVVDIFAGSGMTAIASRMAGRRALVSDISVLGQHIGLGYLQQVDQKIFKEVALKIIEKSKVDIGWLYLTTDLNHGTVVESIRTVWSYTYRCMNCKEKINYYEVFKVAKWQATKMKCTKCGTSFIKSNSEHLGEEPVLVVIKDVRQVEQPVSDADYKNIHIATELNYVDKIPSFKIHPHREMYKRSALEKWSLTDTKKFFSQRNSAVLLDLWKKINDVKDESIRKKLRFCFTAILPRASKRYQWSPTAPLNAANQNYYIAPVFYEWNVYDLFKRKIEAAIKSDNLIASASSLNFQQGYINASAANLSHLSDNSVDYIFTDPPFGSNIFYADMNLFQEAWIGSSTNDSDEAVIKTTTKGMSKSESRANYKSILTKAFSEAYRTLKAGGHLSIVFGNSKGDVWSLAREAIHDAGFTDEPVSINILDKGQRSVKGLNSGTESVATLDLIVTIKKGKKRKKPNINAVDLDDVLNDICSKEKSLIGTTASHVYLEVLKKAFYENLDVSTLHLNDVEEKLRSFGLSLDQSTGKIYR